VCDLQSVMLDTGLGYWFYLFSTLPCLHGLGCHRKRLDVSELS
jgi:hypothetical protein